MDSVIDTWNSLPTWAKIAIPLTLIGVIVVIWAPWSKKGGGTTTLPSGLNSTTGTLVTPVVSGLNGGGTSGMENLGGNYTSPIITTPTQPVTTPHQH